MVAWLVSVVVGLALVVGFGGDFFSGCCVGLGGGFLLWFFVFLVRWWW